MRADNLLGPCGWEHRFGHGTRLTQAGRHSEVYRVTIDRGAEIGMQTAPLPLPDKLSIAALPFTNMRGGLEQEFSADGKRHRCDHDFSVQSVAAFGAVIKCQFI